MIAVYRGFYVFAILINMIMLVNMAIVSGSGYSLDTKVNMFCMLIFTILFGGILVGVGKLIERKI